MEDEIKKIGNVLKVSDRDSGRNYTCFRCKKCKASDIKENHKHCHGCGIKLVFEDWQLGRDIRDV